MYSITTIPRHGRVAISFSGRMEQEHSVFFDTLIAAADRMRNCNGSWDLAVDFSDTAVMPQERAQNTAKIFDWCVANGVRKVACTISSATQLMQIRRVTGRSTQVECFDNPEDAEFWLSL